MTTRRKRPAARYTFLAIRIDGYQVRTSGGINHELLAGRPRYLDDEAPVHYYETMLELSGVCTYPDERAGQRYEMALYTAEPDSGPGSLRIKDLRERDSSGLPRYRKLKSGSYPVYRDPPGLGYLEKVRGQNCYWMATWLGARAISDSLALLSSGRSVYVSINEKMIDRRRQVNHFTIQTTDPAEG